MFASMIVRISNYETPCIHKASVSQLNKGQIMQSIVTYATGIC